MSRDLSGAAVHSDRRIFWIDGFVPRATCARMLDELDFAFWRPSAVVRRRAGGGLTSRRSRVRTSESAEERWFTPQLQRSLRRIESRLITVVGCDLRRREPWQATRYRRRAWFDEHCDCGYWASDAQRERERTVLIYLDTPGRGGSTRFRRLGLDVAAEAGRLVVWNNLSSDGRCDPTMLHASTPVTRGRKTTLVTWIRQRRIAASNGGHHDGRR